MMNAAYFILDNKLIFCYFSIVINNRNIPNWNLMFKIQINRTCL